MTYNEKDQEKFQAAQTHFVSRIPFVDVVTRASRCGCISECVFKSQVITQANACCVSCHVKTLSTFKVLLISVSGADSKPNIKEWRAFHTVTIVAYKEHSH